jgi:5-methylcytosine-specific restriction endonuclease McrA
VLAPNLTEETAGELLAAAKHKSKAEIEKLLAERFPRPDVAAWVQAIPTPDPAEHAPAHVEGELSPGIVEAQPVQAPIVPPPPGDRPRVKPLAPQRFSVQFTMGQSAHDKLRYVQELLGHQVPSGELAQVFERALDALIPQLEKRRFSATTRPRPQPGRRSENPRHIPAHVQRAVWQRDNGQCTFVSDNGHRCQERKFVELDHVQEVARGGEATADNLRLRCRAHNQYQAECTFGAEFMRHKRIAAAEVRP